MSQQPPFGAPPGTPASDIFYRPIPPPKRLSWWKRRSRLGKIGVTIGGLFGAFILFVVLVSIFVPQTPEMKATASAKTEARATSDVATATAKDDRRTTTTAVAIAARQGTQDAQAKNTTVAVVAQQSTRDTQANATANAPTNAPTPVPTEKPTSTPKPAPTEKPSATPKPTATPLPSLNQVVSAKNWDITIIAVNKPGQTLAWSTYGNKTKAEGTWLVVSLDATNTGKENFGLNYSDFTLYDGNGNKYNVTDDSGIRYEYAETKGGSNIGAQVPPGVKVHYFLVFDINLRRRGCVWSSRN